MYGSLLMAGEKRERTRTGRRGWALYRLSLLPVGETLVSLGSQSGVSSRGGVVAKAAEPGEEGEFTCAIGQGQP